MKKKVLSGILALAVMFSFLNGMGVNAESQKSISENVLTGDNEQMEFLQISDEEVYEEEIPETVLNAADRSYTGGQLSLSGSVMP